MIIFISGLLLGIILCWIYFYFKFKKIEKMESELKDLILIQSSRSDQLYTMFIDLLKEPKKEKRNETHSTD